MQFIDLKKQFELNEAKIRKRIDNVLNHGKFIMGPEVQELEERLQDYVGCKHVITCANGTDALQLSLQALNVGPGDAVFTTSFSFFATAEVISAIGATPVFVDICEDSYNIDPANLSDAITKTKCEGKLNSKAVIAVDLFGLPADYNAIDKICKDHDLFLIEDGAQGFGGVYGGKKACSFGDIATTSFFPAKPLGCYGDGGAIFTDRDDYADVLRSLRVHGAGKDKYDNVRVGANSRLDTIQAAILLEKLEIFSDELEQKQVVAGIYEERLSESYITPLGAGHSAWAQFSIRPKVERRTEIQSRLKERNIPTAIYYAKPMHLAKAFDHLGYQPGSIPVSELVSKEIFSIPMHAYLSRSDQDTVIDALLS